MFENKRVRFFWGFGMRVFREFEISLLIKNFNKATPEVKILTEAQKCL